MRIISCLAIICFTFPNLALAGSDPSASLQRAFETASLRAAVAEDAVQKLDDRLSAIEALLRNGDKSSDDIDVKLAGLRGTLEEVKFTLQELSQDFETYQLTQEERTLWSEQRLAAIESILQLTPPSRPCLGDPATCGAPPPVTVNPPPTGDAEKPPEHEAAASDARVATAKRLVQKGQQAAARALLMAQLTDQPDDADAAEVTYLIGQTWLNEGKFVEAARYFRDVSEKFRTSSWAPRALVRSGECFEGLGRGDDAKIFYQSVLKSYPGSDAAAEARSKLGR